MSARFIITGTDTGIGKTMFAAALTQALGGVYFKPVQSGLDGETDSEAARRLGGLTASQILPERYRLHMPLSPHRAAELVEPILCDQADLVIATRDAPTVEAGALSPQQRFGNWLATRLIRLRWGYAYRDLGPFRAIRRSSLDAIAMRDRAFGWTVEMQIRALQEGLRVRQVSVHYKRRIGQSKIGGTIRGSLKAGYWILSTIGRHWFRR